MCYLEGSPFTVTETEGKVHLQLFSIHTCKRILKINTDKILSLNDEHLHNGNLISKWEFMVHHKMNISRNLMVRTFLMQGFS